MKMKRILSLDPSVWNFVQLNSEHFMTPTVLLKCENLILFRALYKILTVSESLLLLKFTQSNKKVGNAEIS